jgi:hypothetical protein
MSAAQEASYKRGNRVGIEDGMTPWRQAERDRNDPKLEDPLRDIPQNHSLGGNKG